MLRRTVTAVDTHFPSFARFLNQRWYELISRLDSSTAMLFMNFGYASLEDDGPPLKLLPHDECNRYCIQLYHRTANAVDLRGLDVIEIGSGRGGGADYIQRYLGPRSTTGVDLAANAIKFCKRYYDVKGLSFHRGNAENLDFPDGSFDAVVNIESSICYHNIDKFFSEVVRLLKPGGHFLYADLRNRMDAEAWDAQLAQLPLTMVEEEDITANVLRALDLDHDRKQVLIRKHAPRFLHKIFHEFAGLRGSQFIYEAFENRTKVYRRYLFRKDRA